MKHSCYVFGIVILVSLTLLNCTHSGLDYWFVDPLVKVFPSDTPGTNQTRSDEVLIARNGHATVQIAIRSKTEVPDLRVDTKASEDAASKLTVQTRWADYVAVGSNPPHTPFDEVVHTAPALFPDPLREDFPFELKAQRTQPVWLTFYAPADTPPGNYHFEATFLSQKQRLGTADIVVRVLNATVPTLQKLKVTNWFNLDAGSLRQFYKIEEGSDSYWELLGNLGRVMADHKQNVMLTPVRELAIPSVSGSIIRYDFSRLDRWVETFEKAGLIGTIEGGHLLSRQSGYASPMTVPAYVIEGGKVVERQLDTNDPRAEQFLSSFLSALYEHLKAKGWTDRYIQHVHDEPHDREAPVYEHYSKLIHKNLPGIPTIDAVSLHQDISFFADVCNIWVPVLGSFDHEFDLIRSHLDKGGRAWFYTCIFPQGRYLNRFIDYPLLKVRLLHWLNYRYGFSGFLHWGGNFWGPKPFQTVQTVINSNETLLPAGDNAIVYPNPAANSILSSIRLEAMRDGIEDYELLASLAAKNPQKSQELVKQAIPHINDYVRDVSAFRKLHRQLLEASN